MVKFFFQVEKFGQISSHQFHDTMKIKLAYFFQFDSVYFSIALADWEYAILRVYKYFIYYILKS